MNFSSSAWQPSDRLGTKAKVADRVIEVLDHFDDQHREATVTDFVRRYGWPQSSTSDLLARLAQLGMLQRDPYSRSYRLTARAALWGVACQSQALRDGGLIRLLDQLVAQTGLVVAAFGMVGLNCQIVTWKPGTCRHFDGAGALRTGRQEPLSHSATGWLLLSTIAEERRAGTLRRLNAEAPESHKFSIPAMVARLEACRSSRSVHGPAGFDTCGHVSAVLLPPDFGEQPLAVGLVYDGSERVDPRDLLDLLNEAAHLAPSGERQTPIGRGANTPAIC